MKYPRQAVVFIAIGLGSVVGLDAQTFRLDRGTALPMTGFGSSFAASGEEIFIGRPGEFPLFPMPPSRRGGVHVFAREGTEWMERPLATPTDVAIGDAYGQSVAVRGNTLAVGAPGQGEQRGAVYVFTRDGDGSGWRETARLTVSDGAVGDELGRAVTVADDAILAGAPGRDGGRGAVHVFARDARGTWSHQTTLAPPTRADGGRLGAAITVDDSHALIGAPGPMPFQILGPPPAVQPGAAYVFRRGGTAREWTEEGRLTAATPGIITLGFAVSLGANGALVSAPVSRGGAGAVLAFARNADGQWMEAGEVGGTPGTPGSLFGISLDQQGPIAVVGAPNAAGRGSVVVFRRVAAGWTDEQRLGAQLTGMTTFFGGAVELDGDRLFVGAPGADFFEGVGVVFERDAATGEWIERHSLVDEAPGLEAIAGGQVDCANGEASLFPCGEVDLVSFMPVQAVGGTRGVMVNDLWGWTDPVTGTEYALVGRTDATAFVDLSDPSNPVYIGELPLTEGATINIWRDIKVYADHAFIVADGAGAHGVQVFDLTQLRGVRNPPVTFEESAHYVGIFSAHNIVINEQTGFAYGVGGSAGGETCGGGLHMIDVRDPKNPTFAGCFSDPATGNARTGYSHDAQCLLYRGPDMDHRGKEICFGANETALSIADVTSKEEPVAISSASYPNVAYAHQGWISDDHRFFYMNDEGDELVGSAPRTRTLVWDVEDLDDPVLLTEYLGETKSSDHNLYIRGRYMYQSNYVSGLRIIDIADPEHPVEVGHFDTVPFGENTPGFAGAWSNYPFFASGLIITTSMREGLFVLKKREPRLVP